MPRKYTFTELKPQIQVKIAEKSASLFVDEGSLTIVDGFITQPIQSEIGGDIGVVIGGPAIPLVAVVGNKSGKIYYFPLKALMPDLDL